MGVPLVEVLIGIECILGLVGNLLGHRVVGTRIIRLHSCRTDDHLSTEGSKQFRFFLGNLVRHGEDRLVPSHTGNKCKPETSVATCTLDDGSTWPERTITLGSIDHMDRDTILDTATRVEGFHFCHQGAPDPPRDPVHPHQRSVSDRIEDVIVDFHAVTFSP